MGVKRFRKSVSRNPFQEKAFQQQRLSASWLDLEVPGIASDRAVETLLLETLLLETLLLETLLLETLLLETLLLETLLLETPSP
jgi:hypothetical protein